MGVKPLGEKLMGDFINGRIRQTIPKPTDEPEHHQIWDNQTLCALRCDAIESTWHRLGNIFAKILNLNLIKPLDVATVYWQVK